MLPTKFRFIWPSGFRGEDLKKSANQKQELAVAAMLKFLFRTGYRNFIKSFQELSKELSIIFSSPYQRQCELLPSLGVRHELNLDSVIWYNSHLKLEGKIIFYKELFDKGILLIRDILLIKVFVSPYSVFLAMVLLLIIEIKLKIF
jgi:hypothetical protein